MFTSRDENVMRVGFIPLFEAFHQTNINVPLRANLKWIHHNICARGSYRFLWLYHLQAHQWSGLVDVTEHMTSHAPYSASFQSLQCILKQEFTEKFNFEEVFALTSIFFLFTMNWGSNPRPLAYYSNSSPLDQTYWLALTSILLLENFRHTYYYLIIEWNFKICQIPT
jgi:hypothetical protein